MLPLPEVFVNKLEYLEKYLLIGDFEDVIFFITFSSESTKKHLQELIFGLINIFIFVSSHELNNENLF